MMNIVSESPLCTLLIGDYAKDKTLLQDLFREYGWRLLESCARSEALQYLKYNPVHVVLAQSDVPDWPWKSVLSDLRALKKPPQLVVTSRYADDSLWSEVLNFGAYDVLQQPLNATEVERVLASAKRHFDFQPERAAPGYLRAAAS